MSSSAELKRRVQDFYDSVGWKEIGEGVYQNARYEDLRPVSHPYLHRCHLRVGRFLPPEGGLLLDAGSGPIQYPEYLTYSQGYAHRVCVDLSIRALREARRRIGEHGLFVVADIARLPFKSGVFEGVVSLHTVHHLPAEEQRTAFDDFDRTLKPGGRAVVVYSWGEHSPLMRLAGPAMGLATAVLRGYRRLAGTTPSALRTVKAPRAEASNLIRASGTFTYKHDFKWIRSELGHLSGLDIVVWRSVSTRFLRTFIHRRLLGREWLRLLFWLEERWPHWLGRIGQYPMILFNKPVESPPEEREAG